MANNKPTKEEKVVKVKVVEETVCAACNGTGLKDSEHLCGTCAGSGK